MTLVVKEIGNNRYVYDYKVVDGKTVALYLGPVGNPSTEQRVSAMATEKSKFREGDKGFTEMMDNGGVMGYVIDKGKQALSRKKEESIDEPIDQPREFKMPSRSMNLDMPPESEL